MKTNKIIMLVIMFLIFITPVMGFYNIQDNFDRSDRALNGDTATNGNNWVAAATYNILNQEMNAVITVNTQEATLQTDIEYNSSHNGFNISFDYKMEDGTGSRRTQGVFNDAASQANSAIFFILGSETVDNSLRLYYNSAYHTICTGCIPDDTWVNIQFTNINFTSFDHDVVVNGTEYNNGGNHYPFRVNDTKITYLGIDSYGNPNITIDNYIIFNSSSLFSTDSLNLSSPRPLTNSQFNYTNLEFNLSANATYNFSCILNLDGASNETKNYNSGVGVEVNFTKTIADGTHKYNISCYDNSTTINTTENTFYVDTVNPQITTNFTNNSFYYKNNLTGQFNFSDDQILYSYNISVDGSQIDGAVGIGGTTYVYNLTYNTTALTSGGHVLSVRTADGHTRKELKAPYDVEKGNSLKFKFPEGGWVKIKEINNRVGDKWDTEKKIDRYNFNFDPSIEADSYIFEITSDKNLDLIEASNTKWEKWLVIGDHWLDFYQPHEKNQILDFNKVNDKKILVTISNLDDKGFLQFSSIGDLNIIVQNYTFYTTNATVNYTTPINEYKTQTINFQIDKNAGITSTYAELYWNNTNMTVTKTSVSNYDLYAATFITPLINTSSENITFNWTYSIVGIGGNESGDILNTQTIEQISIDNCSTHTTEAINFTLINSSSGTPVTGTLAGHFEVWVDDEDYYREFNLTWAGSSQYQLCINPNSATYYINGQLEYEAPTTETFTYYLTNHSIDNSTELINLYLADGTTFYTFTVTDENDNPVQDVYIHILAYDIPTDSSTLSEIIKTDNLGEAFGNVVINTQRYKFLLYYGGEVVLETVDTILTGTGRTFRINLAEDYFIKYDSVLDVNCRITFTNSTKIFSYIYSDPNGNLTNACLTITRKSINGDTILNESCLTSTSGTINIDIGNNTGTYEYIGTGEITIGGNNFACGSAVSASFDYRYLQFGLSGVFFGFLLVVLMVGIFIYDIRIGIFAALIMIAFINLFGLYKMNWAALVALVLMGGVYFYKNK